MNPFKQLLSFSEGCFSSTYIYVGRGFVKKHSQGLLHAWHKGSISQVATEYLQDNLKTPTRIIFKALYRLVHILKLN